MSAALSHGLPGRGKTETQPLLPDASGACLPSPPGSTTDLAAALWARRQHARALALAGSRHPHLSGWLQRYLEALHEALAVMPAETAVAAFRPAVAGLALDPGLSGTDAAGAAMGLIRFLVGGPNERPLGLVIPADAFGEQGRLYFPHLNAVVESDGPLAVEADFHQVRLTWADGAGATLDAAPAAHDPGRTGDRLRLLPSVAGWRVLNGTPDLAEPLDELPTPLPDADPAQLDNLFNGARLLAQVWPQAALAARRYLDSVVLQPLPEDGHFTSLTVGRLQGTLVASMRDPVQVADSLCHEGSHTRLGLLLQLDPLIEDDGAAVHPSPWRPDARPLKGLLNGVHAFVNVCELYGRLAAAEPTLRDQALQVRETQRRKVLEAWAYLEPRARPTALGRHLMRDLAAAVEALR